MLHTKAGGGRNAFTFLSDSPRQAEADAKAHFPTRIFSPRTFSASGGENFLSRQKMTTLSGVYQGGQSFIWSDALNFSLLVSINLGKSGKKGEWRRHCSKRERICSSFKKSLALLAIIANSPPLSCLIPGDNLIETLAAKCVP